MKQEARDLKNQNQQERNKLSMMFSQMALKTLDKSKDSGSDYRQQWQSVLYESKLGRVQAKPSILTPTVGFPKIHRGAISQAATYIIRPHTVHNTSEPQLKTQSNKQPLNNVVIRTDISQIEDSEVDQNFIKRFLNEIRDIENLN